MFIKPTSMNQMSIISGLVSSQLTKIIKLAKEVLLNTHERETRDQSCVKTYKKRTEKDQKSNEYYFSKWHKCIFFSVFPTVNRNYFYCGHVCLYGNTLLQLYFENLEVHFQNSWHALKYFLSTVKCYIISAITVCSHLCHPKHMLISTKPCGGEKSSLTFFDSKLLPSLLGVGQKCLSSMSLYKILDFFFSQLKLWGGRDNTLWKIPQQDFFLKESLANSRKPSVFPEFLKTFRYFCGVFSPMIHDSFTSSFPSVNLRGEKQQPELIFSRQ